ncbi:MAG: hypothetical protein J6386_21070 [Candidatus Synoicihabitans palmerolidicus]|nr:hypothetical protein [Candidatus Synoicihabitans palmerolidicus]
MSQPRLAAIAILGLTGLALQQYRRAEALTAQLAMSPLDLGANLNRGDRPDFAPAKLADAPSDAVVDLLPDEDLEDDTTAPETERRRGGNNNRRDIAARMDELMKSPEFASACQTQQLARLDGRYADLFAKLNLPPEALNQLKNLLAEKQTVPRDVFTAARAEGMGREDRDDIRALIQVSPEEIDAEIRNAIGAQAFNELSTYEATTAQRNLVENLETRLNYTATPLNSAQADMLVNIFSETSTNNGGGGCTVVIPDESIARAQGVLAPDQLQALNRTPNGATSRPDRHQAMRSQFRGNRGQNPPGGG